MGLFSRHTWDRSVSARRVAARATRRRPSEARDNRQTRANRGKLRRRRRNEAGRYSLAWQRYWRRGGSQERVAREGGSVVLTRRPDASRDARRREGGLRDRRQPCAVLAWRHREGTRHTDDRCL